MDDVACEFACAVTMRKSNGCELLNKFVGKKIMKLMGKTRTDGECVMLPELLDKGTRKKRQEIMKLN